VRESAQGDACLLQDTGVAERLASYFNSKCMRSWPAVLLPMTGPDALDGHSNHSHPTSHQPEPREAAADDNVLMYGCRPNRGVVLHVNRTKSRNSLR
jgi:hypothetical protein